MTPPSDKDRAFRIRRRFPLFAVAGLMLPLSWLLAAFPAFTESVYAQNVGSWLARGLSMVSGFFKFSLAELLVLVLLTWSAIAFGTASYHVLRRQRRLRNALAGGLLNLATAASILVALFYVCWGFNYSRPGLIARMEWDAFATKLPDDEALAELDRLCEELVDAANQAYFQAHGCEDLGHPSTIVNSLEHVDATIERAYVETAEWLGLSEGFAAPRGCAKPVLASNLMSWALISGVYSPWTGEANFNRLQPGLGLPQSIAHEKAHQRGVTSEDEANFFGYVVCAHATDPYVRYSGYLFVQRQLLRELGKADRDRAKELIKKRYSGVQRDIDAEYEFIRRHVSRVSQAGAAVNNAYLRANRVKGGIQSYTQSAWLAVVMSRFNGGSCLVGPSLDAQNSAACSWLDSPKSPDNFAVARGASSASPATREWFSPTWRWRG
ncbi:MAG: DUF3810 family protein [Nitrospiraceae bacterium]|nr:DUF3810 family protein [Nitrospiraceae bacterium]